MNDIKIPDTLPKPEHLTLEQVYKILTHAEELIKWLKSIQKFAEDRAMQGEEVIDHKLIAGRAYRKWKLDEETLGEVLEAFGIDPYEKKILSVAKVEKLLSKEDFRALADHIEKPRGKLKLVHKSAKGQAVEIESKQGAIFDDLQLEK